MNSSETTTELSNVPDSYQIEVKASPKFNDINFSLIGNDTATQLNNDTFTFQGNVREFFFFVIVDFVLSQQRCSQIVPSYRKIVNLLEFFRTVEKFLTTPLY